MAVPKRKMSRSNTRSRRAKWKAKLPQLNKQMRGGRLTWQVPHRAHVVEDSAGTAMFLQYNDRKVLDI